MKKLLTMMICVTALSVHSFAQEEEVRRLIREFAEMPNTPTPERDELMQQLLAGLRKFDSDEAFPVYYKILEEKFDDPKYVNRIMDDFLTFDGRNIASRGKQEALDWARRLLREKKQGQGFDRGSAIKYLIAKGDERDFDLIPYPSWRETLAMRLAGTNLVEHSPLAIAHGPFTFVPSVTNAGPQAAYVEAIMRQLWIHLLKKMTPEAEVYNACGQVITMREQGEIPPELLAMVVWFDEDGNPVCNVDLAKYGLTMPEIDLPQKVKDEILRRARPKVATASLPSAEDEAQLTTNHYPLTTTADTPPNRLWLYALVPLFLCAGAGLWFIRKKR